MSTKKRSSIYFEKSKEEFKKFWGHINTKATAFIALGSTAVAAAVAYHTYHNREKISNGIGSLFGNKAGANKVNQEKGIDLSKITEVKKENNTTEVSQGTVDNNNSLPDTDTTDNKTGANKVNPGTVDNNNNLPDTDTTDNKTGANKVNQGTVDNNNLPDTDTTGMNLSGAAISYLKGDYAFLGFAYEAGKFTGGVTVLGITLNSIWEGLKAAPGSITSVPGVVVSTAYSDAKEACSAIKEFTLGTAYIGAGVASKVGEITHIYNGDIETSEVSLGGEADSITDMT